MLHQQRHVTCWPEILVWTLVLDTKLLVTRPGMSNLQLFPVSSLLSGSTLPVDSIADGALALMQLERSWEKPPGGPDCACLFSLLESILCSVRVDSCYYNSAVFFSSIPSFFVFLTSEKEHNASWEFSYSGRQIFGTWHPLNYGFTYIHPSPKSNPSTFRDVIYSTFRKCDSLCCKVNCVLCAVTPHPHYYYITVSMDIHFGNIWQCSNAHEKVNSHSRRLTEKEEWPACTGAGMQLYIAVFKHVPL